VRWDGQAISGKGSDPRALPGLDRLPNLVRSICTPEFAGITFHEVLARTALNRVSPAAGVPFAWTVNPYRGCSHACVYCFARQTHTYLDLDAGNDFDRQIVVKINIAEVLAREVRRSSWTREPVALGTNTDPYQRAEGRYRLMPGVIAALARSGTPFSILTKGTVARRDLPQLAGAGRDVPVGLGVSLALHDEVIQSTLEPGTPSPRARLELVRAIVAAGLSCQVLVAPILPGITDRDEQIDAVLAEVAGAGATSATVFALHLRPGAREWFWRYLRTHHPRLLPTYARLYGGGSYVDRSYAHDLGQRAAVLLQRHGLDRPSRWPAARPAAPVPPSPARQPALF
ncbi:MAG: Rv2578c family radical SAM protein, partial [Actinomycetes bacterium]